jgi:hypothetical protein
MGDDHYIGHSEPVSGAIGDVTKTTPATAALKGLGELITDGRGAGHQRSGSQQ